MLDQLLDLENKILELEKKLANYEYLHNGTRKERRKAGFTKKELGPLIYETQKSLLTLNKESRNLYRRRNRNLKCAIRFNELAMKKTFKILDEVFLPKNPYIHISGQNNQSLKSG